jgi:hypothetical protein
MLHAAAVVASLVALAPAAGLAQSSATTFPLTVSMKGAGSGSVVADALRLDCKGAKCAVNVPNTNPAFTAVLRATPDGESTFGGWSSTCTSVDRNTCTIVVTGARSVTAYFARATFPLTVVSTGSGKGTIGAEGTALTCNQATCTAAVANTTPPSTVVLTAVPAPDSVFRGWSGCRSVRGTACTVTMSNRKTVHAAFVPASYPLVVTTKGLGRGSVRAEGAVLSCSGTTCTASVGNTTPPSTVVLTAKPEESSTVVEWSGCRTTSGTSCTVTMSNARSVGVEFGRRQPSP